MRWLCPGRDEEGGVSSYGHAGSNTLDETAELRNVWKSPTLFPLLPLRYLSRSPNFPVVGLIYVLEKREGSVKSLKRGLCVAEVCCNKGIFISLMGNGVSIIFR